MDMRLPATERFCALQNPCGFRAIWSWNKKSTKFSFLRDLPRNLILGKIKLCSFFPAQQLIYIKNYLYMIEDLSIGFNLKKLNNWGQNSYGRRTIWSLISSDFVVFKKESKRSCRRPSNIGEFQIHTCIIDNVLPFLITYMFLIFSTA